MKSTGQVCVHDSEDDEDEEPQNTSEKGGRLDGVGARERHVRVLGVEREAGSSLESDDAVDRPGVQRVCVQDGQREELHPEEEPRLEGWPTADEREPQGGAPASCEPPPEGTEGEIG